MTGSDMLVTALSLGACIVGSCKSAPKRTVLPVPVGSNAVTIHIMAKEFMRRGSCGGKRKYHSIR